ncbi:MAG TPA: hypothetical protein VFX92_00675 [Candidatus Krumholzibacteria bacterium]|nr:hypothetical protein [Candidatus Krumholzibacteria bacterium]
MKHLRWRSFSLLALVVVVAAMFWACSENDSSNVTSPAPENDLLAAVNAHRADFDNAIAVHNRHIPEILQTEGVAGTAVGSDDHGKPVIVVYTKDQMPVGRLKQEYDGVRVVEQVSGAIKPYKGPPGGGGGGGTSGQAAQSAPVQMGTSGGWRYDLANGYCCGGTLGALVQKGGTKYVLSNYHVLYADIVNGGNSRVASPGDPVIQPGLIDVSCNANGSINVATLVSNGGTLPNSGGTAVDAGIAQVIPGQVDESGAILNVGTISASTLNPTVGLAVKKMGRTTGLTRSSISAINGAFSITYENECAGGTSFTQAYTNQIVITNQRCGFQDGGDSGSLLLEDASTNPRAVGLCFAGSVTCNRSAIAIANPINAVLTKIGATMVGQ